MKSRVNLNAKQQKLKNKLQAIRSRDELIKIYNNVEQQNNTLREDVSTLKQKVDLLMEKQKNQKSFVTKEENKNKQLRMFQIELKEQFKIMSELKKRKEQSNYEKGTEQISERALEVANKLKIIDIQLATTKKEINDLKKQGQRLQLTLANHQQEQKRNQPKINQYSNQNGELKKKILSLRKISMEKQQQSVKIINSMYTVKTKYKKNEEFQQEIHNLKLNSTNQQMNKSNSQTIDVQALEREVQQLKKQVQKRQKQFNKSETLALKRKQQLLQLNKQIVINQKQLQQKKLKAWRELNKYKNIWGKYIQIKNNNKNLKEYIPHALQIDSYVQTGQPLRRDYAGIMGSRFSFDDRQALQNNKTSYMIGFMVYELDQTAKNHLVALKIIYDDDQANERITIPIPGQLLNKCKLSKYMLMQGDFIKLFKVKYQSVDSRILKIEIRTNKNSKYEFGDKRQFNDLSAGENVYGFDISVQEYPVSLFGSYNNIRSQWYLQSLGVQINELSMNSSMVDKEEKKFG